MTLKFGTDGIRGVANQELTPELAMSLGLAAVPVFTSEGQSFLIGRDTRLSGPMLQAALSTGIASAGAHPVDVGVLPTPAVAFLSARMSLPAAMISASHNQFADNGIKFFLPGGKKLSDEVEEKLEAHFSSPMSGSRFAGAGVGTLRSEMNATAAYEAHLVSSLGGLRLDGMQIVIDCANGAAHTVAPAVFTSLGANVTVLFDQPDGVNINDGCGSTHPQKLQETVMQLNADAGFAFDGDADRVLAADSSGALIDGDHLLSLLAVDAKANGRLKDDTLVVTVMANLGLKIAMEERGITVHETQVGDRYVLEALDENGWSLGGEQSGHVIFPEFATTGDGILTALQTLAVMVRSEKSLTELSSIVAKLPQVLRNVQVTRRELLDEAVRIWDEVDHAEKELGKHGRVLLRTSGTEPVVRVMVEAPTQEQAEGICERLCDVVTKELNK